jgi:xylulokinase
MSRNASPPALLGIDLGTSSVKVVVLDLDGRLLASTSAGYLVQNRGPGWAETDPTLWWSAVVGAVHEATAAAAPAMPEAVGFSGQMHGLVATGADGRAVRPAMLWSDSRAVDQLGAYRSLPGRLRARLGNPLTPGMAGPMLAWLAEREPETYAATRWALQPKDWLRAQLTGQFVAEPSDASATLLYDVLGDSWDIEVVAALGLDAELLAPLLGAAGRRAGELQPGPAAELGLHPGIPVAAGAADTAAAALGSGLVEVGSAQLTIGTGAQVVTPTGRPTPESLRGPTPVTHLYRSATDTGWYSMAAVLNGGLALDWVRRLLAASWTELYGAAATPPSADDPVFLPHLSGERTPYLDPGMRGAWVGLGPQHDRIRLMRAALEGVALSIRDAMTCLQQPGTPLDDMRLAGGGTTDAGWRQLLADVLACRLRIVDVSAASGRGAALLAARAAGLLNEPALLRRIPPVTEPSVIPRAEEVVRYDDRYAQFRRSVEGLRPGSAASAAGASAVHL